MSQRSILLFLLISGTLSYVYSQGGKLDATFGDQGIVTTDIDRSDLMYDMLIQPDEKVVVLGYSHGYTSIGGIELITVVRYLKDGALDPEFGDGGISIINFPHFNFDACYAMALQFDGRIVLAGKTNYDSEITFDPVDDFVLFRINSNGDLDSTFGTAGIVITDLGGEYEQANDVLIQEDGKIIAAGLSYNLTNGLGSSFDMVRYKQNGDIDTTFGTKGFVRTYIQENAKATAGVIQPDGKIILSGFSRTDFAFDYAMVRYKENGEIDSLFGLDGIVQTDLQGLGLIDMVSSMILEPDGKIILGGYANFTYVPARSDIGLARYNVDGSLDKSFGENGIYLMHLGSNSRINSMTLQSNGEYILAGSTDVVDSIGQWVLILLTHDGTPDPSFGSEGIVLTEIDGVEEAIVSVKMQNDSQIVAGGFNNGGFGMPDFVLARYFVDSVNSTGIQAVKRLSFSIAPNPSTDFIWVDLEENFSISTYVISDLEGRILIEGKLSGDCNEKQMIDTKQLNSGFYLMRITNNIKSGLVSFIIAR